MLGCLARVAGNHAKSGKTAPREEKQASPEDDCQWETPFRWFNVCRTLEQAHNDKALYFERRHRHWMLAIIGVNATAATWANIPALGECQSEEQQGFGVPPGWKNAINTGLALLTIVLTGWLKQCKFEELATTHHASAKGFKRLILRFEEIVGRGVAFVRDVQTCAADMETPVSARTRVITQKPTKRESASEEPEPAWSPSWENWYEDFERVNNDALLIPGAAWDEAKSKTENSVARENMKKQLMVMYKNRHAASPVSNGALAELQPKQSPRQLQYGASSAHHHYGALSAHQLYPCQCHP